MSRSNYEYVDKKIKAWIKGVPLEEGAKQQLINTAKMPFVEPHIAVMPDVHLGLGSTIGSVIPTKGAIIPAAVGVDIGCGMVAVKTTLKASQLPDNLHQTRLDIEAAVPHGRTDNGGKNDPGAWGELPEFIRYNWMCKDGDSSKPTEHGLAWRYSELVSKHPKIQSRNSANHLGTLGTGNHFIELCLDEDGFVWIMLHSGSRGVGNTIGRYFIEKAKEEMERYHILPYLPDKDLSYLVEKTEIFDDYVSAVQWAQDFARTNRDIMMRLTIQAMKKTLGEFHTFDDVAVNCHHNYIAKENHFGSNCWVTRKGAVRARVGDLGIIPGSMGTGSFIVRGLGNTDSFHSCSHGAGRVMSRREASKKISLEDHAKAMAGIEGRLDRNILDESPAAYKDIGAVMAAQSDLVEIQHRLRQIVNVKG